MRTAAALLPLTCLGLLGGCVHRVDVEVERRSLMDADRTFAEDTARHGAKGWASWFTEKGVMLPSGEPITEGREAIRASMARSLSYPGFSLTWQPLRAEVSQGGDLGYTVGRFEAAVVKNGERSVLQRGKYVTVWRRQQDGTWKVELDVGNPGDPEAKLAAPGS